MTFLVFHVKLVLLSEWPCDGLNLISFAFIEPQYSSATRPGSGDNGRSVGRRSHQLGERGRLHGYRVPAVRGESEMHPQDLTVVQRCRFRVFRGALIYSPM